MFLMRSFFVPDMLYQYLKSGKVFKMSNNLVTACIGNAYCCHLKKIFLIITFKVTYFRYLNCRSYISTIGIMPHLCSDIEL